MGGIISLADAKLHLKSESTDDDTLIASLVLAAGTHIERLTGFVCPARAAEEFVFDAFPCRQRPFLLRLRPVDPDSVTISYIDGAGDTQTFTDFRVWTKHDMTRVGPAFGFCWPRAACLEGAVTITADVGVAGSSTGTPDTTAPENIKQISRLLLGHFYRNREGIIAGSSVGAIELPQSITDMIEPERLKRV